MTSRALSVWFLLVFFLPGWAFAQQTTDAVHATTEQLQALSGEYTSADEPDLPVSFYLKDGQLFTESERHLPTALTAVSATEFEDADGRYRFSPDASGRASTVTVAYKGDPATYLMARTGDAVHHPFPPYERREATIPMRDGIKLHAVILTPAGTPGPFPHSSRPYSLRRRRLNHGKLLYPASGTGAGAIHLRRRRHSRPIQIRRHICAKPYGGRSLRSQGHGREHRCV